MNSEVLLIKLKGNSFLIQWKVFFVWYVWNDEKEKNKKRWCCERKRIRMRFCVLRFAISGQNTSYGETGDQRLLSAMIRDDEIVNVLFFRTGSVLWIVGYCEQKHHIRINNSNTFITASYVWYRPCEWITHNFRMTRQKSFLFFFYGVILVISKTQKPLVFYNNFGGITDKKVELADNIVQIKKNNETKSIAHMLPDPNIRSHC